MGTMLLLALHVLLAPATVVTAACGNGATDVAGVCAGGDVGRAVQQLIAGATSTGLPALTTVPGDSDGDGLSDLLEMFFGSDPYDSDTDDDGLDDWFEVTDILQWGIGDPVDPDQDDDGIDDLHDDFDGDGLTNDVELALGTSPYLPDSDFDGLNDGEESLFGMAPLVRDSDGNGIRDSDEDADGDGLGIVRERLAGTDPMLPDTDGDGLLDGQEIALCTDPLTPDATAPALCLGREPGGVPDWKLFQRGPDGRASIRVPFRYRLAQPIRLDAAVIDVATGSPLAGHNYLDHTAMLPASTGIEGAEGMLEVSGVPQGGNFDLRVRAITLATGAVLANDVARSLAVGDVFLAAGQSNMSGNNGWWEAPSAYEPPDPRVHLFGNDERWKQAREPMDDATDSVDGLANDAVARSSPMLRFANEIARATGVPIAIIPAASSGSRLGGLPLTVPNENRWVRDPVDPYSRLTLYGLALSRVRSQDYGHPIRGVIWYQGESNVGQSVAEYRDALAGFVADLRSDLNPALFFASCQLAWTGGGAATQAAWMTIREAQRRYAASDTRSALVATVDLPGDGGVHLFGAGYREAGRRLAMATLSGSYGVRRVQGPPVLRRSRLLRKGRRVTLSFDRRVTGGDPALFQVVDGAHTVSPLAVLTRGRRVIVDLTEPVTIAAQLSYGYGIMPPLAAVVGARGEGAALAFQNLPVIARLK